MAIVKPSRSRIVNSERYVVCKFLNREGMFDYIFEILSQLHTQCTSDTTPYSCVPIEILRADTKFMQRMIEITEELARKETISLKLVLDSYERKKAEGRLPPVPPELLQQ